MMALSIQKRACSRACAPTLVLLHGWGYHASAWPESWLQGLSRTYDLLLVDLPGHGDDGCDNREDAKLQKLDDWLLQLGNYLPAQYSLLGWSIGGQVAVRLAQQQAGRVTSLVAIASNLSFVQRHDWPHGMPPQVLQNFQTAFAQSANKTLQRFCALQAQGSLDSLAMTKLLRTQVHCRDSLGMGLDWLAQLDLRADWQQLTCAKKLLLAEQDGLVPIAALAPIRCHSRADKEVEMVTGSHAVAWQAAAAERDWLLPTVTTFLEQSHV